MRLLDIISIKTKEKYDEENKVFSRELESLVNTFCLDSVYKKAYEDLLLDCKNGNTSFIDFGIAWVCFFGKQYRNGCYDGRNEFSLSVCSRLSTVFEERGIAVDTTQDYRLQYAGNAMHRTLIQSATQVVLYAMYMQAIKEDKYIVRNCMDSAVPTWADNPIKYFTGMPMI